MRKIVLAIVISLLFISCKNFMQDAAIADKMESLIEYTNGNFVKISLDCESDALKTMVPSVGDITKYKAGDRFNISFEVSDEYQFVKWVSEPSDSITFDKEAELKTNVLITNGDQNITIFPLVYKRPTVTVSPSGSKAVEKNSQIDITFSNEMDITTDALALITVESDGVDVLENFEAPILSEDKKVVTFLPKEENLIPFESGTKNVKVVIPESFYYTKDNTEVTFFKKQVFNYKIKPETIDKLTLVVGSGNDSWGSMNVEGTVTFNMQQEKDISFTINSDYLFTQWFVKKDGSIINKEDYEKFIKISDVYSSNITVKALKPVQNFQLEPYCLVRPRVIEMIPENVATGVYYDRVIQIFFDSKMDEKSIYFSNSELIEKGVLKETERIEAINITNTGYNLLKIENKCYGYSKDDLLIWKNISIMDADTNQNLLKCYQNPVLDSNTGSVLSIEVSDLCTELAYKNIQVTIDNFGYSEGDLFIPLKENYSNSFRANGSTDTKPPVLKNGNGETDFRIRVASGNVYNKTDEELVVSDLSNSYKELRSHNVKNNGLWIYGNVIDNGVGLNNVSYKLEKINSPYFNYTNSIPFSKEENLSDTTINENQYTVNYFLDLQSLNIPAGCYKLTVKAWDLNNNSTVKTAYFAYEVSPLITKDDIRTYVHPKYITIETRDVIPVSCSKITVSYNDGTQNIVESDISDGITTNATTGLFYKKINLDRSKVRRTEMVLRFYDPFGNCDAAHTITVTDNYDIGLFCYNDARFSMNYYPERKNDVVGILYDSYIKTSDLDSNKVLVRVLHLISYDGSSYTWTKRGDSNYCMGQFYLKNFNTMFGNNLNSLKTINLSKLYSGTFMYQIPIIRGYNMSTGVYSGDMEKYISWAIPVDEEVACGFWYDRGRGLWEMRDTLNNSLKILKDNDVKVRNNITGQDVVTELLEYEGTKFKKHMITAYASPYMGVPIYVGDDFDNTQRTLDISKTTENVWIRPITVVDVSDDTPKFYHGF